MRGWDARGEDGIVIVEVRYLDADVDDAFFEITAFCLR